jgi:hypothetical protein
MPSNVEISDKDYGWDAIVRTYERQLRGSVEVGVSDVPHEPTMMPTDEIGTFHEFGLGVPERSFLRAWVDENKQEITTQLHTRGLETLCGGVDWREGFGQWCVDKIRARIWAGLEPPNAIVTALRKGGSTPLIDTMQLVNAILHEVRAV